MVPGIEGQKSPISSEGSWIFSLISSNLLHELILLLYRNTIAEMTVWQWRCGK